MTAHGELGVVVMAYGTPRAIDDVESYYTHIRRGNPPAAEQLADLVARYRAIGLAEGRSPLAEITEAQRAALAAALGPGHRVVIGQKHAAPFIEDALATLAAAGVRRAVGVVLAPHFSRGSVAQYLARMASAAAGLGIATAGVESWHLEPAYLDFLAAAVRDARVALPARTKVLFTAHSLPERTLAGTPETGPDTYPDQLRASARAVAARLGLDPWTDWGQAWQSAGRTAEPWRGPDILTVIDDLGATGRADGVLVCAQGFVADHLEVLYDLDIEATARAEKAGLAFARTRSVNADGAVMGALAARIGAAAAGARR